MSKLLLTAGERLCNAETDLIDSVCQSIYLAGENIVKDDSSS